MITKLQIGTFLAFIVVGALLGYCHAQISHLTLLVDQLGSNAVEYNERVRNLEKAGRLAQRPVAD